MSIVEYLEGLKTRVQPQHAVFVRMYDDVTFRILSEDPAVAKCATTALWPYAKLVTAPCARPAYTIYALDGRFPREVLDTFRNRTLMPAEDYKRGGKSDLFVLTKPHFDPVTGGQTISHRFKREAYVLNYPSERLVADTVRVVQQQLSVRFEERGACLVHAAAVAYGEYAMLFVGESGAGKTTTSVEASRQGCSYMSNDVAIISLVDGQSTVQGWPELISLVVPGDSEKVSVSVFDQLEGHMSAVTAEERPLSCVVALAFHGLTDCGMLRAGFICSFSVYTACVYVVD